MAQRAELEVAPRVVMGKATRQLRKAGTIPANIYGHKKASQAIQFKMAEFEHLRRMRGTRHVLNLKGLQGKAETVLIRHIQYNAVSGRVVHVDFVRVSLSERLAVKVPLHFVGEAPGVKIEGGVLLPLLEAIEVECRASDIIEAIEVDISTLADIDSLLHAKDVVLPRNYTLITSPEEPIVKIAATRGMVEAATAEAEPTQEKAATPSAEAPE